jgi:glycosyltransferase involved in cell wall biosynthesis
LIVIFHRYIHITESLGGGVLTSIRTLCHAQELNGNSTKLVYLERPDTPTKKQVIEMFHSSKVVRLGRSNLIGRIKLLVYSMFLLARFSSHDIIHVHSSIAGVITRIPNLFLQRVIHYTPHCFSFQRKDISEVKKKFYWFVEKWLTRLTPSIILGCSESEVQIANSFGTFKNKYMGNYVELPREFKDEMNHSSQRKILLGTVGRVSNQKNLPRYIEILDDLNYPFDFLWIGGNEQKKLKLSSGNLIEFTGWLTPSAAKSKLIDLDIFLLLSDWEGLPFVALEAMALKKPIMLWNFDSAFELAPNDSIGKIVNSIEEARSTILTLIKSPSERMKLGNAGRTLIENKFDIKKLPQVILNIYECRSCVK